MTDDEPNSPMIPIKETLIKSGILNPKADALKASGVVENDINHNLGITPNNSQPGGEKIEQSKSSSTNEPPSRTIPDNSQTT